MRSISAGDEAKLRSPLWRVRVLVQDAGGVFRDLTTLGGGLFNAVFQSTLLTLVSSDGVRHPSAQGHGEARPRPEGEGVTHACDVRRHA